MLVTRLTVPAFGELFLFPEDISRDVCGRALEIANQYGRIEHVEVPRWLQALWYIFEPREPRRANSYSTLKTAPIVHRFRSFATTIDASSLGETHNLLRFS